MSNSIRKSICVSFAAAILAASMQPAQAAPRGPGRIISPVPFPHPGPGRIITPVPLPHPAPHPAPHPPHHHHGYGAAAGLVGGMIIGGAIANAQQRPVYVNHQDSHVKWCLSRYRSYDISTDTFMSYSGYRKYCNSPYN